MVCELDYPHTSVWCHACRELELAAGNHRQLERLGDMLSEYLYADVVAPPRPRPTPPPPPPPPPPRPDAPEIRWRS